MRTVIVTALLFGLAIAAVQMWVAPEDDNRRSDAPFARAVLAETPDGEPICLIGPGLREDVLFYLGRTLPRVNSIDELPADYRGTAIVTVDQYLPVRRSDRGDELATSAERRSLKDKLFLFRFPKAPPAPRHADR